MARVMVVEDDDDIRSLVTARLQKAGHQVIACGDPATALDTVQERGHPDVAVLDVGLPGQDGFVLLGRLREATGQAALPAVFLTARVSEADIARGRGLGAQYLTKPFVATALFAAVDRALASAPSADGW